MNNPTKIAVIGAGGIGCNLLPILSRMYDTVIVDGDEYEPKNVERQFPALKHKGPKAQILAEMLRPHTTYRISHINDYVRDAGITTLDEWSGVDFIVSGVDNNTSRRILCELSDSIGVPVILAGNEHISGEAHIYIPGLYDPMEYFSFPENPHDVPWGCNTDAVIEANPQTPMANFLAAGCAIHLLMSWREVKKPENAVCYSRSDSLFSEFKRVRDQLRSPTEAEKQDEHTPSATGGRGNASGSS